MADSVSAGSPSSPIRRALRSCLFKGLTDARPQPPAPATPIELNGDDLRRYPLNVRKGRRLCRQDSAWSKAGRYPGRAAVNLTLPLPAYRGDRHREVKIPPRDDSINQCNGVSKKRAKRAARGLDHLILKPKQLDGITAVYVDVVFGHLAMALSKKS
jgi:hypothetical protein